MQNNTIGLDLILTIIFVILKLTNVITWSWIWVLSPMWIGALVAVALVVIFGILSAIFDN